MRKRNGGFESEPVAVSAAAGAEEASRTAGTGHGGPGQVTPRIRMPKSRRCLVLLVAASPIAEAFAPLAGDSPENLRTVDVICGLAIAVLLFVWCRADASERGVRPPLGAAPLCAVLAPVGIPYYLFRTRAVRPAALGLLAALGLFLLAGSLGIAVHVVRAWCSA